MRYVERGEMSEAEARLTHSKMLPHPFKTATDALTFANPAVEALPCTYIECTLNSSAHRREVRLAEESGWSLRRIEAGHSVMLTHPSQLAALLVEAALTRQ